ncbi:ribosomal RNA methyltransferase RrmJ/FtsJ [Paenibacillus curdlanolyticus YK9]|uniref:Ribosomal RNA methyltransferase RrmJ/FtsJ n=1 Tax=Paenibacillus curdlanolyticus YK9 TaxID=717606 RepID=E0I553_9BACL|nr:SAM-dependent methyltransferase [Paenibacillus curdlanolyticus]EFM12095.1 ribosomal RNA methyltransferase RrmJ/FtsJ [Paenibacillus curdlanolyticus YK9]
MSAETQLPAFTQWIGTSNQGYAPLAMEEVRRTIEGAVVRVLAPGETFLIESPLSHEETLQFISANPPIFLRHIQPVDGMLVLTEEQPVDALAWLSEQVLQAESRLRGRRIAVHVRRTDGCAFVSSISDTKHAVDAVLRDVGAEPEQREPQYIVSIYAVKDRVYVGMGTPDELMSDWPGGAIRFQREDGQISRAKFKLVEAERAFGLDYTQYRDALDIGAAPGGWTSLLLERGVSVTAIDPAALHPSIVRHPKLTYLKRNASEVKFKPNSFDLLVCDMSWSPMQMVKLVMDLTDTLCHGATAIVTIKLMHKKPLQTIRDVMAKLSSDFIVHRAKQLFHNREEITLFMTKR